MRRGITILVLLFGILFSMNNKISFGSSNDNSIPDEAIRLRIIANSNDIYDQEIKLQVRDEVLEVIAPLIKDVKDAQEARMIIYHHLDEIREAVAHVLTENDAEPKYYVDYGLTYFPAKVYNNQLYPAGRYESVYIVLGEGEGDNWWCVLFPTLCIVDLATGDMEAEDTNIKYSFLIVEKLKEWFQHK